MNCSSPARRLQRNLTVGVFGNREERRLFACVAPWRPPSYTATSFSAARWEDFHETIPLLDGPVRLRLLDACLLRQVRHDIAAGPAEPAVRHGQAERVDR